VWTDSSVSPEVRRPLLEVIVETVADARAAEHGGAGRLEVVRALEVGGLTPDLALVRAIADAVRLPLRVMVRGNAGYGTDARERVALRHQAAALAALAVDGLVVGFAEGGEPSLDDVAEVIDGIGDVGVTFHRAFDQLRDPPSAIEVLCGVPQIDRLLTSGGGGRPEERCARLAAWQRRAGDRLTVIAGGGVDEAMLAEIAQTRCVREVHVGRAAREGLDPTRPVSAERVAHLVARLSAGA
jgi:copper homeostasis protein